MQKKRVKVKRDKKLTKEQEHLERLEVGRKLGLKPSQIDFIMGVLLHEYDGALDSEKRLAMRDGEQIHKSYCIKKNADGEIDILNPIHVNTLRGLVVKGLVKETKCLSNSGFTLYQVSELNRFTDDDEQNLEKLFGSKLFMPQLSKAKLNKLAERYGCKVMVDRNIAAFKIVMNDKSIILDKPFIDESVFGRVFKITDLDSFQWIKVIEQTLINNGITNFKNAVEVQ